MGSLCIVGGVTGYARTKSIPSLVAGVGYVLFLRPFHFLTSASVGLPYLWSAGTIRRASPYGVEGALGKRLPRIMTDLQLTNSAGASALLFLSSLPRVAKGPVPVVLAATSAATGVYYGRLLYNLNA